MASSLNESLKTVVGPSTVEPPLVFTVTWIELIILSVGLRVDECLRVDVVGCGREVVSGGHDARQSGDLGRVTGRLQPPRQQITGQLSHGPQLDQLRDQSTDHHLAAAAVAAGAVGLERRQQRRLYGLYSRWVLQSDAICCHATQYQQHTRHVCQRTTLLYPHHTIDRLTGWSPFNPLTHSNGPLYSNAVTGTLAVDGWAVTFGTARTALGGLRPRPVPSSLYQM